MLRVAMMTVLGWQVNGEENWDWIDQADEINLEIDYKDEVMHVSKWAMSDFQRADGWWARKGSNRWGAGTARGLKKDQVVTGCIRTL